MKQDVFNQRRYSLEQTCYNKQCLTQSTDISVSWQHKRMWWSINVKQSIWSSWIDDKLFILLYTAIQLLKTLLQTAPSIYKCHSMHCCTYASTQCPRMAVSRVVYINGVLYGDKPTRMHMFIWVKSVINAS